MKKRIDRCHKSSHPDDVLLFLCKFCGSFTAEIKSARSSAKGDSAAAAGGFIILFVSGGSADGLQSSDTEFRTLSPGSDFPAFAELAGAFFHNDHVFLLLIQYNKKY